jgi:hypothetical protein
VVLPDIPRQVSIAQREPAGERHPAGFAQFGGFTRPQVEGADLEAAGQLSAQARFGLLRAQLLVRRSALIEHPRDESLPVRTL